MSVPYLDGATIDFEDTIQKQGFTIDNPNAAGSAAPAATASTELTVRRARRSRSAGPPLARPGHLALDGLA